MSDDLYKQARALLREAAKTPPAVRFRQRVEAGQIDANGNFKAATPVPPKNK